MPPDPSQPSDIENRKYYRITITLPIRLQLETDQTEGPFIDKAVNLSGGGIGITITTPYQPGDILAVTLFLPDHGRFTAFLEVLRIAPLPHAEETFRLHGRFIRMSSQDQDLLIRKILKLQRDHLRHHYLA